MNSPTPWRLEWDRNGLGAILDAGGEVVSVVEDTPLDIANAELIVCAVNANRQILRMANGLRVERGGA